MEINLETIEKLASLSKLQFNNEEKKDLQVDMQRMLDFVNKLNEINTEGVEPLLHITKNESVLREDSIQKGISRQEALSNAAVNNGHFFMVPKVIKK